MIVTLAGHVDHGKTSLVRALTGTNTDRLAEEQRRGLTIDLGFAYMDADGTPLGFVDVPGHHRFIHNMVAGVANMQYALLVIAADDGPMPQSREHLQILSLIGVQEGVVALTKSDRVLNERLEEAELEIETLLSGSFLEGCRIITTSAETGEGVETLREHLASVSRQHHFETPERRFRLAVDRAFSVKGSGVIATGTVHAGDIQLDQELTIFPSGKVTRVRGIHAQNQTAERAAVGDRTALNLSGIEQSDIFRGAWLLEGDAAGHRNVVMQLRVLDDFPRRLRHWTPVHVYHATTHSQAHIAMLDSGAMQPGDEALVDIVCEEPLLAKRGDRLVLRDHSLDRTIGGGVVIDNAPRPARRRNTERRARLEVVAACRTPEEEFAAQLVRGPVSTRAFNESWNLPPEAVDQLVSEADVRRVGEHVISNDLWRSWREQIEAEIRSRHEKDAALQGLKSNELAGIVSQPFLDTVLTELVSDGALSLKGGFYRPAGVAVNLSPEEKSLLVRVARQLDARQPPSLGDIAKSLNMPQKSLERGLKALAGKGQVVTVSANRFYLPEQLKPLAELAAELAAKGPFTVRDFRDAAGVGRNVAIEVLEYFDSRGFTRRADNTRQVTGELSRLFGS